MSEPENSVAGIDYLCWIGTIAAPIIYVVVSRPAQLSGP